MRVLRHGHCCYRVCMAAHTTAHARNEDPARPADVAAGEDGRPVDAEAFSGLMERFAPFEQAPRLVVGLSGGADSMSLMLLVHEWARARGGLALACIVDHGLRAESADEAAQVATSCMRHGIAAHVRAWRDAKPDSGIEEAARRARHEILGAFCRQTGSLHLLLAHHRDDQAETVAMRRIMKSGELGLSGMSSCHERAGYRVLRPFLNLPKSRLEATLLQRNQSWFDDPMNRDLSFLRVRLRRYGAPPPDAAWGRERNAVERRLAGSLPGLVEIDALGHGTLDRTKFLALDGALRRLAVSRLAQTVGGLDYPPRGRRLDALVEALASTGVLRASLGRCTWRGDERVLVTRERRNLPWTITQGGEGEVLWDGRFRLYLPAGNWTIGPLDPTQWREVAPRSCPSRAIASKFKEIGGIPAVYDLEGLASVPHLGYARDRGLVNCRSRFAPKQMLVPASFVGAGMTDAERR